MGGEYKPNYEAMFNKAISALAKIDEALGVQDYGCNSTEQTIAQIKLLHAKSRDDDAEIRRLKDQIQSLLDSYDD